MATMLRIEDQVEIPMNLQGLAGFRRWAVSETFPERGRIDYLAGSIEVDMSPEDLHTHGKLRVELIAAIGDLVSRLDLGELYTARARVSCPAVDLSAEALLLCSFCALTAGFLIDAFAIGDPMGLPHLRLGDRLYLSGILGGSMLAFYSDPSGPYTGSIIALADPETPRESIPRIRGFGPLAGAYYRHITFPDGDVLWTLLIGVWYPIVAFSILPLVRAIRSLRSRKRSEGTR
jgi:hypothetical protein